MRLGHYLVQAQIGAGGMGEVFQARDMRLGRDVAVKVLPPLFADDVERVERFAREAQLLATFNHPNIATIYGFEECDGVKALILELVEGPTLADRIAAGPLPLNDAVAVASQLIDALEAAHDHGIIHRDLKPANVKLRPDGIVKVLDFGLAKALEPSSTSRTDPVTSPTLTARATIAGTVIGTAAYMAPEQARGTTVDQRADIWAFGCVLFEMLTGKRAFEGEHVTDTLAFVITRDPDWTALSAVPPSILRLLRRCLTKDRKRRLAHIADARLDLDDAPASSPAAEESSITSSPTPHRRFVAALVAASAAIAILAAVVWVLWPAEPRPTLIKVTAALGGDLRLSPGPGFGSAIALSPDGTMLAFTAIAPDRKQLLYVRRLSDLAATPLAGTEGAGYPFFSPDAQWVAFFADGRLKRIPVNGGAAVDLAFSDDPRGGDWSSHDGTIVFTPARRGTWVLAPSVGSQPAPLTPENATGREEAIQRWPQVLPGNKGILYTSHSQPGDFDSANLMVRSVDGKSPKVILRGGYYGRYARSGHLLYVRAGTLFAVSFDLNRLEVTGQPVALVNGLVSSNLSGAAQYALADDGTLAYVAGPAFTNSPLISWLHRKGTSPLRSMTGVWETLDISPDGRRLAVDMHDGKQFDIWSYEWGREIMSRVTSNSGTRPVWTTDARRVTFASRLEGTGIYWQPVDGGPVEQLTKGVNPQRPASWHPSGEFLAFTELNPQTNWDVMILPMTRNDGGGWTPGTPYAFVREPYGEVEPTFSRDGKWLAYQSDDAGRNEVFVRPFPGSGPRQQISNGGGTHPIWSPTRNELYYAAAGGQIMSVTYTVQGGTFSPQKPQVWAQGEFTVRQGPTLSRSFDIHPDGERFAVAIVSDNAEDARHTHVTLVFNAFEELRRIAPAAR
jgi:serine/threonine-protein kinase